MKQFPREHQEQNTMVVIETVNVNPSLYENETNGGLNGQNIPVESLTHIKFEAPTNSTVTTAKSITTSFQGQTQQYKSASRWNKDFAADFFTALASFDLKTEDWNKGWNRLEEVSNFDEVVLDINCKEGMLNGLAQINFRHGFDVVSYTSGDTTINATVGEDWWTRWGLFVNDVLIAETGKCYPRLENLVIPFSIPVGSQAVRIDLRWKSITTNALLIPTYTSDPTTPLEIFGAEIWARNTYR